jgi:ankyrin repeat protein
MDRAEVAELLIAHGAEVDARTKSGYTPLIWVAQQGNRDFAERLIVHNADVNAKDSNGRTPLIWALTTHVFTNPYRLLSRLDAAGQQHWQKESQKLYQISAAEQQEWQKESQEMKGQWLEVAKLLIDHGADIKADLKKEGSLLYSAANLGYKDLVEALIAHGADINDAKGGETALHGAIAERHRDVAELLINKGADVTLKNMSGRTPLHFLANYIDDQKLAELMIKHGADINARDKNGETPLTFATKAGNNQVAKVLRERGGK